MRAVPDCIGNWLLLFVLRFKELSINDMSATPFCETIQRESVEISGCLGLLLTRLVDSRRGGAEAGISFRLHPPIFCNIPAVHSSMAWQSTHLHTRKFFRVVFSPGNAAHSAFFHRVFCLIWCYSSGHSLRPADTAHQILRAGRDDSGRSGVRRCVAHQTAAVEILNPGIHDHSYMPSLGSCCNIVVDLFTAP